MKVEFMDSQRKQTGPEIEHKYGPNIHILNDLELLHNLAILGMPETKQPDIDDLIIDCYRVLMNNVINGEFRRKNIEAPTRMIEFEPEKGVYRGPVVDDSQHVVCVNLMRAGILPSQVAYHKLTKLLGGDNVTQHHLTIARKVDSDGQVQGADISGLKIDALPWKDYYALICDPMGATGGSTVEGLDVYHNKFDTPEKFTKPKKVIGVCLAITPEFIHHLRETYPEFVVYTARLDRGLSHRVALANTPGSSGISGNYPERGLNDHQYIVPGLGGVGEIINNTKV